MSDDIESDNLDGEVSEILEIAKDYAVKSPSSESSNLDPSFNFQEILDGLAQIFHEVTGTSIDPADYEKKMNEELGIDSLALVEGLMACEDMFGIEIPDTKVFELDSLSKVAQYISTNRGN
jgi:acyl carrier protein